VIRAVTRIRAVLPGVKPPNPGRPSFGLTEERTMFFGCRPDLLSVARIQEHKKYICHFGNRPEESL